MQNEEQKNNLRKLAEYLQLPVLKAKFSMLTYDDNHLRPWSHSLKKHTCGTVGCAIGHGPYATEIFKGPAESWNDYCLRVFGIDPNPEVEDDDEYNKHPDRLAYMFMFVDTWGMSNNELCWTAQQAAKRIEYFLEHGTPAEFDFTSVY